MAWHLKGVYFETCNCEVACPCVFLSEPSTGECTVLIGWHIEDGSDGDVSLDGLSVALAVHSPGHMMETPWRAAAYVDDRADEAQQQSLLKIFGGQAGGHPARLGSHIGELLGAVAAPSTPWMNRGTYNQIVELGVGSRMTAINVLPPGQSGDPFDPHFADQLSLYVDFAYMPMHLREKDVRAHASSVTRIDTPFDGDDDDEDLEGDDDD